MRYARGLGLIFTVLFGLGVISSHAEKAKELNVAVAADFAGTAKVLGREFSAKTGIPVKVTSDATGILAKKIKKGAEFDVFMAADTKHPEELINDGLAVGEPVVYALGILALYGKDKNLSKDGYVLLASGGFSSFAIADPEEAPYGRAAVEVLKNEKVYDTMEDRLVYGGNIAKTLELIDSGEAEAGLVSYPDLADDQKKRAWIIPQRVYRPIEQAAVVLKASSNVEASQNWIKFLETDRSRMTILSAGYGLTSAEEIGEKN